MSHQEPVEEISLRIENIGGIDATEVELSPGVTVLSGRNATNRTSFLRAVMGVLGSQEVSLKADAEAGRVELDFGDEQYVRTVSRGESGMELGGEPYLDDPTTADLFAFLLRTNPARQAIVQRADLRDVIMEPVDTEAIQAEISRLEERRRELDRELEDLDVLESRLPELEQREAELKAEITSKQSELENTEESIEEINQSGRAQGAAPDQLEELRAVREQLQDVRRRIETERESIEALREDRTEVKTSLNELGIDSIDETADLDSRIDSCRERKRSLESTISRLRQIHQFNARVLENGDTPFQSTSDQIEDGSPTDELVDTGQSLVCWTCGNEAEREAFEGTQEQLRAVIEDHREQKTAVEDELSELREQRESLETQHHRRERLETRQDDIESELETRKERLSELEAEQADLEERVKSLEATLADTDGYDELVALHRKASDLEYELGGLQRELTDVDDEISSVEAELDRRDDLEDEWETVQSELMDQRERIDRIETNAIEAFNDEMATVIDRLGYDNIARIWLERKASSGAARFELNVARETEGVTYEDSIEHLSESEREVTGLVFALAGYIVHDVYESVPFVLLDSLEAIDAGRIARLIEYFAGYARYLVVALLPEDASALDDEYDRLSGF